MNICRELLQKETLSEAEKKQLCNSLMTSEPHMERLIIANFEAEDFRKVSARLIGGGLIGGKACGLLMARKLIKTKLPEFADKIEPHDSFFIGSEVFCKYQEMNDCLALQERLKTEKENFDGREELAKRLRNGMIPDEIVERLKEMLDFYGDTPIIVRSSSFLEDGYGNAFSGKYESIFCMNQGTDGERLEELKEAIRRIYASTMDTSALEYRRKRKLLDADEQMALLVQRVAGERHGDCYFPAAAGMGCSYNPYKWMENMNPDAGMLRLVAGLGTRAVARTPGDYPRLVGLDRARASWHTTAADRHKFSQRNMDVLNFSTNSLDTRSVDSMIETMSATQKKLVLSRDREAEHRLSFRRCFRKVYFADCQGIVENTEFIRMMRKILKMLEDEYERPVDIEFAVGASETGISLNMLQCRPLQREASERISIPEGIDSELLFDVRRTSMRRSKIEKIDFIVWVDPQAYYDYPYEKKPEVARLISRINRWFADKEKKLMLLVPGRIGTSSPELGVPVVYADISQFAAICEVAYSKAGYRPELSYGSHMFQDLVEADTYYGAINENSKTRLYHPELLQSYPEVLTRIMPREGELTDIVKIYEVTGPNTCLMLDAEDGRAVFRLGEA